MSELRIEDQSNQNNQYDVFPHVADKVQHLANSSTAYNFTKEHHREQLSEFRQRFPWLAFTKNQKQSDNQSKYTYMGRDTQKCEPFYVSFDVKNTGVDKKQKKQFFMQMESIISSIVQGNIEKRNRLVKQVRLKIDGECQYEDIIGRAYLLVGLARPSITINQIYDSLFYQIQTEINRQLKQKQSPQPIQPNKSEEDCSNSQMEEDNSGIINSIQSQVDLQQNNKDLIAYNKIRKNWQSKRKSYEFHKLMCRAYLYYEQIFIKEKKAQFQKMNASQQKFWSKKMIQDQLFSHTRGQRLYLRNTATLQEFVIEDQEYYCYFMTLFQKHAKQILEQIEKFQEKMSEQNKLEIKLQNSEMSKLQLQKYDYRSFAINLCKGVNLAEESLSNMIEYHRRNHDKILSQIRFQTKQQRLKHITNLQKFSNKAFRIKLVPLAQLQSDKSIKQYYTSVDNYLIVLQRMSRIFSTKASKQFTLDKLINQNNSSNIQVQPKFLSSHLFQYIYQFKQMTYQNKLGSFNSQADLIQKFSFNPKNIVIQYKKNDSYHAEKYPKFERALELYLGIDRLPLSYEQQMLSMTPNQDIDIHQYIQELYKNLKKIGQNLKTENKIIDLQKMCARMSSKQIKFFVQIENIRKFPGIVEGKVIDENKLNESFQQIMRRPNQQRIKGDINLVTEMSMQNELEDLIYTITNSKELVQLILKSVSKKELLKLLMLSLFSYQLTHKDKYIFYKPQSQDNLMQSERQTYKVWNQQDQQKMYQYAMILLSTAKVIDCVKFRFLLKSESYKSYIKELHNTLKKIIISYLSTLAEYFYYLLRIVSAEPSQRHSLIKIQTNREQSALESMFRVYDQLMNDANNDKDRALLKVGVINILYKEKLQMLKKLINTQKYLKDMEKYCVSIIADNYPMTIGQEDYNEKNFRTLYQEIQKRYHKINQLYQIYCLKKYPDIKLDFKEMISEEQIPYQLKESFEMAQKLSKNIQDFFRKLWANHPLQDFKNYYLDIIQHKQKQKKLVNDQKAQFQLSLLNKLAQFAIFDNKFLIKSKKDHLDPMIDQKCKQIEQNQILLFNLIYHRYYQRNKVFLKERNEMEMQQINLMKLKLLMFFLYCQPTFNKNYIQRLYMKPLKAEKNYELIRTMSLMIKKNIEIDQLQGKKQN